MQNEIELMRALLFALEARQTSPRMTVVIDVDEEADNLGVLPEQVEGSLNHLFDLEYIDGPGLSDPGFWLFRKLTRKGMEFVRATREPRDWARLKQHYANRRLTPGA